MCRHADRDFGFEGKWVCGWSSAYNAVCLAHRRFLTISVTQTEIAYNFPCLSNFDVFVSLGAVFVVYIPHLVVAIAWREECWVFTVPFTPWPSLWELSLQQKLWRAGKETCSHSVQLWKLLCMQISFTECIFCWMPILPSIMKATLSYLHRKAATREGLDFLASVSLWGYSLQQTKRHKEICLKL